MNSPMPCTPILVVGSRIDGPDDMNSLVLQCPATVHAVQWFVCSESGTLPCTVLLLQCLILAIYFWSDGSVRKVWNCSLVPCPQRGTGSRSVSNIQRKSYILLSLWYHKNINRRVPHVPHGLGKNYLSDKDVSSSSGYQVERASRHVPHRGEWWVHFV
jgi:hypothetical protein